MQCYVKDYPRPQFVRNNWQNFNGTWDFRFDDKNIGEIEKWYSNFHGDLTIEVPFTYETKLSSIGDQTRHDNIWYHRTIQMDGKLLETNNHILHFEGSDFITKLWVNGQYAGNHRGGYARFSFDIPNLLHDGENELTVKVEDSFDTQQPRGKRYMDREGEIVRRELYFNKDMAAFADGYEYKGQPILISEFGGIAFSNEDAGWGYGDKVSSKQDFIRRFDSIVTAIKELPYCCGYCYTQVTDVQQEINGLMDIDRNFKIEPEIIRQINERVTIHT